MLNGNSVPIDELVVVMMGERTADNLLVVLESLPQYGAQPQAHRMVGIPRHPTTRKCWAHFATTRSSIVTKYNSTGDDYDSYPFSLTRKGAHLRLLPLHNGLEPTTPADMLI